MSDRLDDFVDITAGTAPGRTLDAERARYAARTRHLAEADTRRPKFPFADAPVPIGRLARIKPLE